MQCIVKYKENDEEFKCFCGELTECSKCNNGTDRKSDNECEVGIGEFCTCRNCGFVVRA